MTFGGVMELRRKLVLKVDAKVGRLNLDPNLVLKDGNVQMRKDATSTCVKYVSDGVYIVWRQEKNWD